MPLVTTSAVVTLQALRERWVHRTRGGAGPRVMALCISTASGGSQREPSPPRSRAALTWRGGSVPRGLRSSREARSPAFFLKNCLVCHFENSEHFDKNAKINPECIKRMNLDKSQHGFSDQDGIIFCNMFQFSVISHPISTPNHPIATKNIIVGI